jgi:hypothetical protein
MGRSFEGFAVIAFEAAIAKGLLAVGPLHPT